MHSDFQLPADAHVVIADSYAYWQRIRPAPDLLPGRRHFEPTAIPRLLPHIWLVDVTRDPLRFRYRVVGSAVDRGMGQSLAGKALDEVIEGFFERDHLCGPYIAVAESAIPSYRKGLPLFGHNEQYAKLERLLLPLASDGQTVDMLFCTTLFYGPDGRLLGSKL